jgi:hypothetical protein
MHEYPSSGFRVVFAQTNEQLVAVEAAKKKDA